MLDQYVKMFELVSWIDAWLIEAVSIIIGAMLVGYVVVRTITMFNGDE